MGRESVAANMQATAIRDGQGVTAGVPTWHVNIAGQQVEFYEKGALPNGPPTRVFNERETFEILGVRIRVSDLFAAAPARPSN